MTTPGENWATVDRCHLDARWSVHRGQILNVLSVALVGRRRSRSRMKAPRLVFLTEVKIVYGMACSRRAFMANHARPIEVSAAVERSWNGCSEPRRVPGRCC
jgi:hypothetical protein